MKNYFLSFLLIAVFLLSSCATTTKKITNYDDTNPVRIEQATYGLDVVSLLSERLEFKSGTIAIRSIEEGNDNHLDDGVIYMIEDAIVSNLVSNGYRMVERDPETLENLYRENSQKYKKSGDPKENTLIETLDLNVLTPEGTVCCETSEKVFDYLVDEHKTKSLANDDYLVNTGLDAADYILSYRVLECGVLYYELEKNSELSEKIKRSARTRLHCRLSNAKTSEILAAGLVENEIIDIVKRSDVKEMSYSYYHHTLPLKSKDNKKSKKKNKDNKKSSNNEETAKNTNSESSKQSDNKKRWWLGLLFPLFSFISD